MIRLPKWRPKTFPKKNTEHRQEIHCHNCNKWVQFIIDESLDGNHVLECPNCGHEHCRVVENGKITDFRWDSRNSDLPTHWVTGATFTTSSVYNDIWVASSSTGGTYSDAVSYYDWGS